MAIQLDQEQKEAVEAVNTNILVSASAGAGKTGVLVQRLKKRIVIDHIRVSRILAMTFTSAAAGEMKKRLAYELHSAFEQSEDPKEAQWLRSQLIELEAANITTIDSYCLTIIKKYFPVIGLDPETAQNILSSGSVSLYQSAAFHQAMEELIEKDPDKAFACASYFSARSENYEDLKDIIDSINQHAQSAIDPSRWYEEARDSYRHIDHFTDLSERVQNVFFQNIQLKLKSLLTYLDIMKIHGENDPKVDPDKTRIKRNKVIDCYNACNDHHYVQYSIALEALASCNTSTPSKENLKYKDARDKLNDGVKKLLAENYDETMLVKDHNDLREICETLIDLAKNTWNLFISSKRNDACMDFTDMERYAFDILNANDQTVAKILRDSFDEIMVDEFQDTSDLQNAIIDRISNGHNVFRVGDVKQSIYRFRQAKPSLMRDLMNDPNTKQITLRHNFRSMRSIVEFSNHLFLTLMNIEGCANSYTELDTVSIGSSRQEENPVPVEFALIHMDEENDMDGEEDEDDEIDAKLQKAHWISQQILKMKLKDPSLSYKDFCILVRSHRDKTIIRQSFDLYNIPYNIDAREGFYQSSLALTILALVKAIRDPADPVSLLAVLTSNFYRFTDRQLALLKIRHGSIYEGISKEYPEILQEFKELKQIADQKGIEELLTAISIRHDFYNTLPSAQKSNFDYLFETVCNSRIDSLDDFLEAMEASKDEKSSEAISIGKDDDVVTVTTIHQSKGLQYGYVFLWSTARNDFQEKKSAVIIDDTLKLGLYHLTMPMRARRNTVQRIAVEYCSDNEDMEEFIRLLYVAVTRAEKRLFIVDAIAKEWMFQDVDLSLLKQRKGMTNLILNAVHNDPLFHIIHVKKENIEKEKPIQKKYVEHLPHLSFQPKLFGEIYTPSSLEFHALPELDHSSRISGTSYGTHMHEVMESLPNRVWKTEDLKGKVSDYDIPKFLAFSSSDIYQKALTMQIHKEYPFYINKDDERITGTMDFVSISDTEIILIDYKTDNASVDEIKQRYTTQLNTYKHALQIMYPNHSVQAYAYSFHHQQFIKI